MVNTGFVTPLSTHVQDTLEIEIPLTQYLPSPPLPSVCDWFDGILARPSSVPSIYYHVRDFLGLHTLAT